MSSINDRIRRFLEELSSDPVEDRIVEYVVREAHKGRMIIDVIDDPYVRNRLNDQKRAEVLENPEVLKALDEEIKSSFKAPDIDFSS
jgi:hypothetical protein